jgi:hypothetical protein
MSHLSNYEAYIKLHLSTLTSSIPTRIVLLLHDLKQGLELALDGHKHHYVPNEYSRREGYQ